MTVRTRSARTSRGVVSAVLLWSVLAPSVAPAQTPPGESGEERARRELEAQLQQLVGARPEGELELHFEGVDFGYRVEKATFSLDGVPVASFEGAAARQLEGRFFRQGNVAPGEHVLGAVVVFKEHAPGLFDYGLEFTVRSTVRFRTDDGLRVRLVLRGEEVNRKGTEDRLRLSSEARLDLLAALQQPELPPLVVAPAAASTPSELDAGVAAAPAVVQAVAKAPVGADGGGAPPGEEPDRAKARQERGTGLVQAAAKSERRDARGPVGPGEAERQRMARLLSAPEAEPPPPEDASLSAAGEVEGGAPDAGVDSSQERRVAAVEPPPLGEQDHGGTFPFPLVLLVGGGLLAIAGLAVLRRRRR